MNSAPDQSKPRGLDASDKEAMQQLNKLEFHYYEKMGDFWKQLFLGCTGFIALVVPLTLSADIVSGPKRWLVFALFAVLVAAGALIIPLLKSAIVTKKIFEYGKEKLEEQLRERGGEYKWMITPQYYTRRMIVSLAVFGVAFLSALMLLCYALYASIK